MGCNAVKKWPKEITASLVLQLIRAEKDLQKAIVVFDAATAEYSNGFRHDNSTFGLMIRRLLSGNQFKLAEEMLDRMQDEKCTITEDIFLSMYRAYGRVHKPLEVIRVFQMMKNYYCEPTEKTYFMIFSILVDENRLKTAFRFYRSMKTSGFRTSTASLNILIKALAKSSSTMDGALKIFYEMPKRGHAHDSYTYGTLIHGFCRLGRISEAKELLTQMVANGCQPNVVTYTCLIQGLCKSDCLDEAVSLLEDMKGKGIQPNVFTYTSVMDGLCKTGQSSQSMALLETMVSERQIPNMITYSTLMDGLCKEGKLSEALEVFDLMKLQGIKPDAGLYWKIIGSYLDINKSVDAANFLDEMILEGISPNRVTWGLHVKIHNAVVQSLCKISYANRAFQIYQSMRSRGISVEASCFESLVRCFCKKEDLQKSAQIVEEMLLAGCIPDKGSWSAVLGGLWDMTKVWEVASSVQAELVKNA